MDMLELTFKFSLLDIILIDVGEEIFVHNMATAKIFPSPPLYE